MVLKYHWGPRLVALRNDKSIHDMQFHSEKMNCMLCIGLRVQFYKLIYWCPYLHLRGQEVCYIPFLRWELISKLLADVIPLRAIPYSIYKNMAMEAHFFCTGKSLKMAAPKVATACSQILRSRKSWHFPNPVKGTKICESNLIPVWKSEPLWLPKMVTIKK